MIRKAFVALSAVLMAGLATFTATQAAGAQYAPESCTVAVAPTSAAAGATVTLSGSLTSTLGPVTPSPVTFSIGGVVIGEATTGADGSFSVQVTIPTDLGPGTYTIVADCGPGVDQRILGETEFQIPGDSGPTPPGQNGNAGTGGIGSGSGSGSGGLGSSGLGSGSTGSGGLARTGTDLGLPVQIGVALLALGGVLLALSASRRRRAAAVA